MILRQNLISATFWLGFACVGLAQSKTSDAGAPGASSPTVLADVESTEDSVSRLRNRLIDLLNDETARRIDRQLAIRALGRFPSSANISPLLNQLLFPAEIITESGPMASFPAAVELAAYGNEIYAAAWGAALREWSDDYAYVLAFALYTADGKEVAIIRVKKHLVEPEATREQKNNFTKLLEYLTSTEFGDHRNWPRGSSPKPR